MHTFLRILIILVLTLPALPAAAFQDRDAGLRGNPEAIADAQAMVEAMGGMEIWAQLNQVHFVHVWDIYGWDYPYIENEYLDFTGPRSYVTMKSEIYSRIRAYSPEYRYWNIVNGEFSYASEESLANALERAPYSIYRLAAAIARGDDYYHVQFGPMKDMPDFQALEFRGPDNEIHGWILLNTRKEPVIWATTQYRYTFGPLARFGNLWVPNWATTSGGLVRYEMVSLQGSNQVLDLSMFQPPEEYRE